jgi:NDP-sugar pyrophosphorylase family protein
MHRRPSIEVAERISGRRAARRSESQAPVLSAIVLAAGQGERMMPYSETVPKALLPVLDRPLLDLIAAQLERAGIERIGVNAWYRAPQVTEFAQRRDRRSLALDVRVERRPSGPAGALRVFSDLVRESDVTVVVSGDCLVELDVDELVKQHLSADADVGVLTSQACEAERYGVVTSDTNGRVLAWREKPRVPKHELLEVNCGVYTIAPRALASLNDGPVVDFGRDLIEPLLARGGAIVTTPARGQWRDIGTPGALLEANLEAAAGRYAIPELLHDGDERSVFLGEGAVVQKEARIFGPAVIGGGALVGANAHVARSLLLPGAEVKAGDVVEDKIVAP